MIPRTTLRRAGLAVAGGLALFAAHPPLGLGWLGLVALVPLAALARDLRGAAHPLRAALGWGWLAGVTAFAPMLHWLTNVGETAAWPVLVAVQSAFVAAFVAALVAWGRRPWRPLVVVVAWVALEAVRSSAPLGGFPWGVLGYSQHDGGPLLDLARSFGVLGVSAACAAVAAVAEEAGARIAGARSAEAAPPRARVRTALTGMVGVAALGAGTVAAGPAPAPSGPVLDIAAIQGFDVEGSTGRSLPRSIVVADKMRAVTADAVRAGGVPDLVVWPENAIDGDVSDGSNPQLSAIVDDTVALLDGTPLLAGVISDGARPATFENTVVLFDGEGTAVDRYVKRRLVPFGEYVPFRPLLGGLPPLRRVPSDGVPGAGPRLLEAAGARVGAVICYEVIFPGLVHDLVREGADVLVVATNNTSFGRGAASDQHLAFSQLRAVETGRWVVHAALSGKSAIVDPAGRLHQVTDLYAQAVVRGDVPLVSGTTLATRVGDGVGLVAVLLALGGGLWAWTDRRRPAQTARPRDGHAGPPVAEDPAGPVPSGAAGPVI